MTTSSDFIKEIKPIDYPKYSNVSSREKLVVYTIDYLANNEIPLTFNNICIATFKLFPEKFYFSEDFKEYPHIEMLNRTILHLRPKERNYATGSVGQSYALTKVGEEVAREVKAEIEVGASKPTAPKKIMDEHKKTNINDLNKVKRSGIYQTWLNEKRIDDMEIWSFFDVTPFTRLNEIKSFIKGTKAYSQDKGETDVVQFLEELQRMIP